MHKIIKLKHYQMEIDSFSRKEVAVVFIAFFWTAGQDATNDLHLQVNFNDAIPMSVY